jgi:integrase
MRLGPLKHLPEAEWPPEDHRLFDKAFAAGDIFDDNVSAGAHLAQRSRRTMCFGWRRWLGFLAAEHPDDLQLPAADRVTPDRVRAYIEHLADDMNANSVAMTVTQLYNAARLITPDRDWLWLKALKRRLCARAHPKDRFDRLVPAHQTLDLGIALMETADGLPVTGQMEREIQFRDGLILALLSLWPIRRRSLAALTLDRHIRRIGDQIELLLFPEDTKAKRMESWPVPDILLPYVTRYLDEVRPRLARRRNHGALWVGQHGHPLSEGGLYSVICRRTAKAYGLAMSPHDLRRAAATFLAMDAPDKVGLIPGILQHATPETSERHYNLARSTSASRRHSEVLSTLRTRLRPSAR